VLAARHYKLPDEPAPTEYVLAMAATYEPLLHVVLHQPEIPYNTGSVGRTCVAVGAKLWLIRPLGFRVDDYHLRRAGLDYWEHLHWEVVDDWAALVAALPAPQPWLFTKKADPSYLEASFQQGDILVFGSESNGLPEALLEQHADRCLRIPIRPDVRSLNLSNSVAVATYEALRQWQGIGNPKPGKPGKPGILD
jgi:tRNA (cytidine/uridine-2'-O-)-methyltransferase